MPMVLMAKYGMSVTLLWELAAMTRGSVAAPAYLLGLQTIYPALVASVGTLVGVTVARRPDVRRAPLEWRVGTAG